MNFILNKKHSNSVQKNLGASSLSNSTKFEMRTYKSFKKLPKIKGILKKHIKRNMVKNNSDSLNDRRVSFGWREESF